MGCVEVTVSRCVFARELHFNGFVTGGLLVILQCVQLFACEFNLSLKIGLQQKITSNIIWLMALHY